MCPHGKADFSGAQEYYGRTPPVNLMTDSWSLGLNHSLIALRNYVTDTPSVLVAIFSGGPGLAGTRTSPFWILLELRMMEVVVTTGATRRPKL